MAQRFPFKSLRDWISFLDEHGDIVHNKKEVDIWGDIAAISRNIALKDGPAIMHENVQGFPGWRVYSDGLTALRRRLWALDLPSGDYLQALIERIKKREPMKPVKVDGGPCKEIKLFGNDIDLVKIPIPFSGEFEIGPHITAGISFIKDSETGWTNAGIRRFQIMARDKLTNLVQYPQHEALIFMKYKWQKRPAPISISIGADPIVYISSLMPARAQADEMDAWGQLTGEPLEVVKSETNDIYVPASSEIIIEGEMDSEMVEFEGPFPEFPGYYSGYRMLPVIKVKAITMRRDPIAQYMYIGIPPSEGHHAISLANEVGILQHLKTLVPEVKDVAIFFTNLTGAISIDKKALRAYPGLGKRVAMAAKVVFPLLKNLFLVDDDVNPHDARLVLWCLSVKFQGDKNIMVIPETSGVLLDPSEVLEGPGFGYTGHTCYTVFDCTEKLPPYDEGYRRGIVLPPTDAIKKVTENWKGYGF